MAYNPPRFGVWANVHGTFASTHHPEDPVDASWNRVKNQILLAEKLGFDSTLIAQHNINVFGEELDELEGWTAAAALAALTERIEIIAAIKPLLIHPVPLSKFTLGIEEISAGRFGINLVNAWYKPELEKAGIPMPEHDERYAYGAEWLKVVRSLTAGERTNFSGKWFEIEDYLLRPASRTRARPTVYAGGESEAALALVAEQADVWFINGQPAEDVERLIANVRARPRSLPNPLRYGLSAFVIARETEEEAREELAFHWELNAFDKEHGGDHAARFYKDADRQAIMWQTFERNPHIGVNGGTASGLVGSYDAVARKIDDWNQMGIETFMLQFQPFEAEMERFAVEVIPRVRKLAQS